MKHYVLALVVAATLCTPAAAQNKVKNLYTTSTKLDVEQFQNMSEQTLQLNRYLFAGYNTLCLPLSMTAEQLSTAAKDLQVERLAAVRQEGSTLYLYFLDCTADGIEAGVPYLVFSPTEQNLRARSNNAEGVGTTLQTVRMTDGNGNTVAFNSSWEALEMVGRYGIPAQQDVYPLQSVLIRTTGDKKFLPTRCGFVWEQQSSTATELKIKHVTSLDEAEVAGIKSLTLANAKADIYDLKGNLLIKQASKSQLKSLPRGVYVVGGEKVAVK